MARAHEALATHNMDRRNFLMGLGATGALAATGGIGYGIASRSKGETPSVSGGELQDDPEVAMEPAGVNESADSAQRVELGQGGTFELDTIIDPNIHAGRRSPDYFRQLAEKSPEKLAEAFAITTEQVPAPDDFPEIFAERFNEALNTGKTLDEVMAHINNPHYTGDETSWFDAEISYLTEMQYKYDAAILDGMFRVSETTTTADNLGTALRASRKQFFRHVRENGNINSAFVMDMYGSEVTVSGTGSYDAEIDVQFTDTSGSSITDPGQIVIGVKPDGDALTLMIARHEGTIDTFEDLKSIN